MTQFAPRTRPSIPVNQWITATASSTGTAVDQYPGAVLDEGVATASSSRNTVVAVASVASHTEGLYAEIDASLSADASGIYIALPSTNTAGTNTSTMLEIAIGVALSEVVWATIGVGYRTEPGPVWVPGFIASGTRVAVRCRSAVVSKSVTARYTFLPAKTIALPAPTTYGADTATSRGLTITAPGSLNTKGAWTGLVASTASAFSTLACYPQGADGTVMNASGLLIDIGIGGAGSETVLIADMYVVADASEGMVSRTPLTYGVNIPAGSRISARYARANAGNALDLIVTAA